VTRRRWAILAALGSLAVVATTAALGVGPSGLGAGDVVSILLGGGDPTSRGIVLDVRLPRILLALLVGAALSAAGATYQAVLRNPLADPYVLGISGGAALGAVAAAALSEGATLAAPIARPAAALAGALAMLALLFRLGRARGRTDTTTLLLIGVVLNALASAAILFLVATGDPARFYGVLFFMMGLLESPAWSAVAVTAAVVGAGVGALVLSSHALNVLSLGDEEAAGLGLRVETATWVAVVAASLLIAAAVAFAGIIGFVGLIVPHAARALVGPDHRALVPGSALLGGAFLVLADTAARVVIAPAELPVGVLTALLGGPFFLALLVRRVRESS
jgi:iron complex transport system permease protein